MAHCTNCGVELEDDMQKCPLCGKPVSNGGTFDERSSVTDGQQPFFPKKMDRPQKKFIWEIISIILISSIIATLVTDFIITRHITWSEYPVAVCLIVFSYVSLFALWNQRTVIKMACAWIISSIFLLTLDVLTGGIDWVITLGIPVLFLGNVVTMILLGVIRVSKHKGINLIAYIFIAAGLFCLCIEGVLSFFKTGYLYLRWSLIVVACVFSVSLVLFFVHYRLKKGQSLEKTFHL